MDEVTRRTLLAATAAGGMFAAATAAGAQTSEPIPQPRRPGHGGTDHGPRNLSRDRQNPDLLVPPSTDSGTLPNLRFSFADAHMRLTSRSEEHTSELQSHLNLVCRLLLGK